MYYICNIQKKENDITRPTLQAYYILLKKNSKVAVIQDLEINLCSDILQN